MVGFPSFHKSCCCFEHSCSSFINNNSGKKSSMFTEFKVAILLISKDYFSIVFNSKRQFFKVARAYFEVKRNLSAVLFCCCCYFFWFDANGLCLVAQYCPWKLLQVWMLIVHVCCLRFFYFFFLFLVSPTHFMSSVSSSMPIIIFVVLCYNFFIMYIY